MTKRLFLSKSTDCIQTMLRAREISCVEIASECIRRYEEFDKSLFPYESFSPDLLLKQAAELDAKGRHDSMPLMGIPVAVKDVFNTVDYPTQMGSKIWEGFTPGNDARTVFDVKEAGGLVAGKTVTAEFAVHALNKTLNPWDVTKTPGTSSSGSATAVALGIAPLALGTQTAGSIIRPASFCGVYGFKPSFGLLSRVGVLKTTDSLDTIGMLASNQKNLRALFSVLHVRGYDYPFSHAALTDASRQSPPVGRPWRVAFIKTHTWSEAEVYAQAALESFAMKIDQEDGFEVVEVELPNGFEACHDLHETIYRKSLGYYFVKESEQHNLMSEIMASMIELGKGITPAQLNEATRRQEEFIETFDSFVQDYDVVLSLSTAGQAPDREALENRDPSLMWTFLHLPSISLPLFSSPQGLPFGAQVASRKYNDYLLLNFVDELVERSLLPECITPPKVCFS